MAMTKTFALLKITRTLPVMSRMAYSKDGSAGAIRDAGGAFGKMETAEEARYFQKLQTEQLKKLKDHLDEEIGFHQEQIKQQQDSIAAHQKRIAELQKKKEA